MAEDIQETSVEKDSEDNSFKPPKSVDLFVGRAEELAKLAELFSKSADNIQEYSPHPSIEKPKVVICTGLGGIGKTELASRYAAISKYQFKLWFNAQDKRSLYRTYCRFAREAELIDKNIYEPHEVIAAVNNFLASLTHYWLIVFDGVLNEDDIIPYLPKKGRGDILITSRLRNAIVPIPFSRLEIDVLGYHEALKLSVSRPYSAASSGPSFWEGTQGLPEKSEEPMPVGSAILAKL